MSARYYYFTPLDFDTVFKTQVIDWVNRYIQIGLNCTIVRILPLKRIKGLRRIRAERNEIRKLYKGRLVFLYTLPEKVAITGWINSLMMLILLLHGLFSGKKAIIQIRSSSFYRSLARLKGLAGKSIRIIYDSRAAAAEEYLYNEKDKNEQIMRVADRLRNNDRRMVALSDRVFCVSNALTEYHINLSGGEADPQKFFIYPCNAEEKYFFFSEDVRRNMRSELHIGNKLVIAYSGGLEMPWHMPDMLFQFYKQVSAVADNSFLMIITNECNIAATYSRKHKINDKDILILAADNRDVHKYLNAADMGTLFRDYNIMNRVASPTKFAEYIMCGLPVAISPGIGDLSDLITRSGWGFIYESPRDTDIQKLVGLLPEWATKRREIADYGHEHLSKQSVIEGVIKAYAELQA